MHLLTLRIVVRGGDEDQIARLHVRQARDRLRQGVEHVRLVPRANHEAEVFRQVVHHPANETAAVQEDLRLVLGRWKKREAVCCGGWTLSRSLTSRLEVLLRVRHAEVSLRLLEELQSQSTHALWIRSANLLSLARFQALLQTHLVLGEREDIATCTREDDKRMRPTSACDIFVDRISLCTDV